MKIKLISVVVLMFLFAVSMPTNAQESCENLTCQEVELLNYDEIEQFSGFINLCRIIDIPQECLVGFSWIHLLNINRGGEGDWSEWETLHDIEYGVEKRPGHHTGARFARTGSMFDCLEGVLIDKNGQTALHTTHVNSVLGDYLKKYKEAEPAKSECFEDKSVFFPERAIAAKAKWMQVYQDMDTTKFYVSKIIPPDSHEPIEAALVGLHIAIKKDRCGPWFWMTLEHRENAPPAKVNGCFEDDGDFSGWSFYSNFTNVLFKKDVLLPTPVSWEFTKFSCERFQEAQVVNEAWKTRLENRPKHQVWSHYLFKGTQWGSQFLPVQGNVDVSNSVLETQCQRRQEGCYGCHRHADYDMSFTLQMVRGTWGSD